MSPKLFQGLNAFCSCMYVLQIRGYELDRALFPSKEKEHEHEKEHGAKGENVRSNLSMIH